MGSTPGLEPTDCWDGSVTWSRIARHAFIRVSIDSIGTEGCAAVEVGADCGETRSMFLVILGHVQILLTTMLRAARAADNAVQS